MKPDLDAGTAQPAHARLKFSVVLGLLILQYSCYSGDPNPHSDINGPVPPIAAKIPNKLVAHGDERIDNYYWIRDETRTNPAVLDLLNSENAYTREVMAHTRELQGTLLNEMATRVSADDRSVPVRNQDFYYYREFREGGDYPVYLRRPVEFDSRDEIQLLLDVNQLAHGYDYYSLANWSVSPKQDLIVFAEDSVGQRQQRLRIREIGNGAEFPEVIDNTNGDIAWANDNRTFYYVRRASGTMIPDQVYRHRIGEDPALDIPVYQESDPGFNVRVYASRNRDFVIISARNNNSSEYRLIDAGHPESAPVLFLPREPLHEYTIHPDPGGFYVRTNWQAENFRLMYVSTAGIGDRKNWVEVIPARPDVLLRDIEIFADHLVTSETNKGLSSLRILGRSGTVERVLSFDEAVYAVSLFSNPEYTARSVKYRYSSFTTPDSVFEYDMDTGDTRLLKQDRVSGDYNPAWYKSERLYAPTRDGRKVPISLVYRKTGATLRKRPIYLYAYGAYGISVEPAFSSTRLSLLDRGFVYAIIHVRGGQEMGRQWYLGGKMLNKRNTFTDFIDATRYLVDHGFGKHDEVFASGGSAGGLLMGVIANEAPELYLGILAHVPFVDVVTTMLDETIPLTTGEFAEWGDPRDKQVYEYMLSYSPYDRVRNQEYPNMFVTTGLWDSQVQYFEPVKWVEKLRDMKLDNNTLLLAVDMESGHGGASDAYLRYRVKALEYAFVLDLLGIEK